MYETFSELKVRTAYILNFNAKAVDGDFTDTIIGEAVNSVYEMEFNRVLDTSDLVNTQLSYDMSWPGRQVQLPIPAALQGLRLNDLFLVDTDGTETQLVVYNDGINLIWPPNGPDSTMTIRFKYQRTAGKLVAAGDQPTLFPKNHREFLAWAAAIQLKEIADQDVPKLWYNRLDDMRASALKATESLFANQRHQYQRPGVEFTDYVNFDPQ